MWTTINPKSWEELIAELYADSWDSDLKRFRSPFAFRGSVQDWPLETSLMRLKGPSALLERHLVRNFRKYAHADVVERDSFWHWLTMAQHHGLPTRLLDWTYSPFVALHFATDDLQSMDKDGVIWMVNLMAVHEHLPRLLAEALAKEGSIVFTVEMLAKFHSPKSSIDFGVAGVSTGGEKIVNTLADFDRLLSEDFLLFLEPPSIDSRVVNQFALFSVLPSPALRVDQWLERHPSLCRKIVVPSDLKWEARDKLDQANITERVLFPGLDGLTKWLRRHYSTPSKSA